MKSESNLYDRNLKAFISNKFISSFVKKNKSVFLKYIEIPITTRCSLNCRECCNLIQFYEKPYNIELDELISDIDKLCLITKKIKLMRILGGEPLLHPDLDKLIKNLLKSVYSD